MSHHIQPQEPKNEYSHLDPKSGELSGQTTPLNAEDEELLRAVLQTEQIGELEANDLMQFAYQIATGMVRMYVVIMLVLNNYCNTLYYNVI